MATETALDHLNPIRASVGVTAFQKYCGGTKGKAAKVKRALKSDADFVLRRDQDAKVLALHKHDAIQVSVNSENICSVFFLTTAKPAVATERATALLKQTKLIKGTGKKMMRFRTDYKSSLGTVIVLNHEVLSIKGMEIALMR
ncbi:hypothetical protein [Roseovarius aestuarii]|nr:hypothetical protein [Roseovarius aestuarii]